MVSLTFWLAMANIAQIALGVGRAAIVMRWLGVELVGQFNYALAFVAFADMMAQAGLNTVLTRDIAAHPRQDGSIFGAVLLVRAALSVAAGIVVGSVAGPWAGVLVLSFVGQLGVMVLRAKLMKGPQIVASLMPPVLSAAAVMIAWASREPSVQVCLAAVALGTMAAGIVQLVVAGARLNSVMSFSVRKGAEMLRTSWPFWLAGLTVIALYRLDVLMLRWLLGPAGGDTANGYYFAATRVIESGSLVLGAVVMVAFPAMAATTQSEARRMRSVFAKALAAASAVGGVACLLAYPLGAPAVRIVAGEGFGPAVAALHWLAPTLLLVLVNSTTASFLTVLRRPFLILAITTIEMVFNALLNLWAIPRFGFVGAAAATTAAEGLGTILLLLSARAAWARLIESR